MNSTSLGASVILLGLFAVNHLGFGDLLDKITEGFPDDTGEEGEDIGPLRLLSVVLM